MTTPHGHARLMLARRTAQNLLEQWGSPHPEERARTLIDALQAAGWGPPRETTHLPPRGAHSTEQARRAALDHLAAVIDANKQARVSPTSGRTIT